VRGEELESGLEQKRSWHLWLCIDKREKICILYHARNGLEHSQLPNRSLDAAPHF
jgi:hypothetical protein